MGFGENFETVAPAATASTNSYAPLGAIDARNWPFVSYTIKVATDSIDWEVFGADQADFSDEVSVQAEASVAGGANSSFSTTAAVWGYYRVKIKSTVADTPGTVTLAGFAKG